jgi:hypothetical protein
MFSVNFSLYYDIQKSEVNINSGPTKVLHETGFNWK